MNQKLERKENLKANTHRLLIVGDESSYLQSDISWRFQKFLEEKGLPIQVEHAFNLGEGFSFADEESFDFVLIDTAVDKNQRLGVFLGSKTKGISIAYFEEPKNFVPGKTDIFKVIQKRDWAAKR